MSAKHIVCNGLLMLATGFAHWLPATVAQPTLVEEPARSSAPIVLRDLSLIRNDPVRSFDDRDVVLASGKRLPWNRILKATVDEQDQAEFDRYLNEIGLPIYRLESRLVNGDWASVGLIAEPMYAELISGSIQKNDELGFLVCRATMESRLYQGNRMGAVEPFFRAVVHQTRLGAETNYVVTKTLFPDSTVKQKMSEEILPVWFDGKKAAMHVSRLNQSIADGQIPRSPGVLVYLASMAVAAENYGLADQLIAEMRSYSSSDDWIGDWAALVEANRKCSSGETGQGKQMLKRLSETSADKNGSAAPRAIALFLLGSHPHEDSQETQMLHLLTVPALYGIRYPSLSAASLYRAFKIAKEKSDTKQSRIVLNELLRRYPNTYHGRLAAIEN